ncbi:MAG: hypothetical protein IJX96_04475 [Clostridia bacterium]|nr:hypothetical protein [Clostridia bacterium]
MIIDIISYTDAQYAALTEEQLLEVKSAQLKKNKLDLALEEAKLKEKHRLIDNGIFLSKTWALYCEKLQAEHDSEVENLRESLLFYLRFSAKAETEEESGVGYTVDYALSIEERFAIVKQYYEINYTDETERFEAFKADKVAVAYLGELYAPLYDYFYVET